MGAVEEAQAGLARYARQVVFSGLGPGGQRRLASGSAVVVGCGALGCLIASALVRAGVGRVRVIDRDFVEVHNLHRQLLFTEADARASLPKALAAKQHLDEANSEVKVEGIVADFSPVNAEELIAGADVIVDGLDNFEARLLLNDVALKHRIPWVYGGAIGSSGMTAVFLPGRPPCLRCLVRGLPSAGLPTCETAGVINVAAWLVGSLEAGEALKILAGSPKISRDLVLVDVWERYLESLPLEQFIDPDCPACHGRYEFLDRRPRFRATALCGQNAVQIWHAGAVGISLDELRKRLEPLVELEGLKLEASEQMLRIKLTNTELVVFYDGRAVVRGTRDEKLAKSLYARYVGI